MTIFIESKIRELLETRLAQWNEGHINWNINNQFDETILVSALAVLDVKPEIVGKVNCQFKHASNVSVMELARSISDFDQPEINRAWID